MGSRRSTPRGAHPIEIVVANESGVVRVRLVDVMFRTRMFFEDAGKWLS